MVQHDTMSQTVETITGRQPAPAQSSGAPVRLRMLVVIGSSEAGGLEHALLSVLKRLDRDRFEVWIVCHGRGALFADYQRCATQVWSRNLLNIFDVRTILWLAGVMRRFDCQLVSTSMWTTDVLGGLAAALARVPMRVAIVQGEYFRQRSRRWIPRLRRAFLSIIFRGIYGMFHEVIATSQGIADDLRRRPGLRVDPRRITVIRNGCDLSTLVQSPGELTREALGVPQGAPLVVTVATLMPYKGHRWLVETIPDILARVPGAVFLLVGKGAELPAIRRQVERAGLEDHVKFLGWRRDATAVVALSDLVVLPSISSEGTPLALMEAMALGKPVVSTRVGGIPELIDDGRTGLLVEPGDHRALAEAVVTVLSNASLACRLAAQGRQVALARFSDARMAQETQALFLRLAMRKGVVAR